MSSFHGSYCNRFNRRKLARRIWRQRYATSDEKRVAYSATVEPAGRRLLKNAPTSASQNDVFF
jgi:hypothetical protein